MTEYYVSQAGGSGAHDGLTVNTAWSIADLAADGTKWHGMRGASNIVHIMGNITSRLFVIPNTGCTSWDDRLLISGLTYSGRVVVTGANACVIDGGTGCHYIQIEDLYLESTQAGTGTGMYMYSTPATGENRFYRLTINNCVRNGLRIAKDDSSTLCKADIRDCVITNSGDDNIFIQENSGIYMSGNYSARPSQLLTSGDACQFSAAGATGTIYLYNNHFVQDTATSTKQALMITPAAGQHVVVIGNTLEGGTGALNTNGVNGCTFDIRANMIKSENNWGSSDQFIARLDDWDTAGSLFCGNILLGGNLKANGLQPRVVSATSKGTIANNTIIGAATASLNLVKAPTFVIKNNIFYSTAATYALYQSDANWDTNITLDRNCYYGGTFYYNPGGVPTPKATLALWSASASEDDNSVSVDPGFNASYGISNASLEATGEWIANVRGYDDLFIPLRPDIGAVQDRNAAGRKFGVGGGAL